MRSEWRELTVGEVANITSSKRIYAREYVKQGIPFYRSKEIIEKAHNQEVSTPLYISRQRFDELDTLHGSPKKGDILLTSVGTLGVPYLVKDETFYFKDGNLTWFRVREGLEGRFLYYWFLSPDAVNQINARHIGSTQKALPIDTLKKFEILVPPLSSQKAIADTLSCLDAKIELNNKINENLEAQAQAIFKSWFVDFEPFQNGEFVESELGLIPKGWRIGTISDLGEVIGGSTPSKKVNDYYPEQSIPWITPKDLSLNKTKFVARGQIDITEEGLRKSSAKVMPKGTVLFSSRAPIGYIAIAKNEVTTNQGFKSVVPKASVGTEYTYFFLKNNIDTIEARASGSTFKEVSGTIMKQVPALVPSEEVLERFGKAAHPNFRLQETLEEQNQTLRALRDTLLPKLMSGEIEVPVD